MPTFKLFKIYPTPPRRQNQKTDSIKPAMQFPIKLAQFFGFFPPAPVTKSGRFSLSWRTVYSLVTFFLFLFEFLTVIQQQLRIDPAKKNILMFNGVVFHVGGLIQNVLIFKISMEWPYLCQKWTKVEKGMANYSSNKSLRRQLKMITVSIVAFAAAEHVLVNAYKLKTSFQVEHYVPRRAFRNYFKYASYSHVFEVVDYSVGIGILVQYMNLQRTFNWNFVDVFVMLIGAALSFRLKIIRKRLESLIKLNVADVTVWKRVRERYISCVQLVAAVNERISYIIFASFSLNLYFILFQLFGAFRPFNNNIERVYFGMSFGLLLTRLVCVCYFGGEVYEEWKNIRFALNSVRSSAYNEQVETIKSLAGV
ncbi:hypothetical protein NQ315_002931 [Exocentrus adspersus]|uniref:Gustatory receptor n=1 Tax=Exocentrus adspersus TaxID=1586481 RepID=A0AAV8W3Z9_9CUCU|nr:hypothetical protein NQ315_002931 [Exocentrus adspersus]